MSLVELAGGVWSSAPSILSDAVDGYALDATAKRIALIVRIEKAGTLEAVEFKPGSDLLINAASAIRVSFQNVDSAGDPDGTQDQFRDMLGSSLSLSLWKDSGIISSDGTDTGTKRSVSRGDVVAIVFEYQTFTAADVFSVREIQTTTTTLFRPEGMPVPESPYPNVFGGASWAHGARDPMSIALRYADGSFAYLGPGVVPLDGTAPLAINDGFHPDDETGLLFKLPVEATLRGVRTFLNVTGSGINWQIRVYNDVGTQLGESAILTAGVLWGGGYGGAYRILTTDVDIIANRWYRATVRALSGATAAQDMDIMRHRIDKTAHLDAWPGGRNFYATRRANNGVWTDEQTIRPAMDLHFSHFADAAGGGVGGGSGAPGRGFFRGGIS